MRDLQKDRMADTIMQQDAEIARLTAELADLRAGQDALVAATVEAAAQEAEDHGEPGMYQAMSQQFRAGYADAGGHIASVIRALTPADATAALDVKLRAERNKALRWAAEVCVEYGLSKAEECHEAILAMIEPEGK